MEEIPLMSAADFALEVGDCVTCKLVARRLTVKGAELMHAKNRRKIPHSKPNPDFLHFGDFFALSKSTNYQTTHNRSFHSQPTSVIINKIYTPIENIALIFETNRSNFGHHLRNFFYSQFNGSRSKPSAAPFIFRHLPYFFSF
jgi:hypothetical protein